MYNFFIMYKKSKEDLIKMSKSKKTSLREKGITLIALVVTIIVLLILAGVTISLALGNNGIIGKAQHGSNTWANATKDEEAMMGQIVRDIDSLSQGGGTSGGGSTQGITGTELTALANNGMSELTGNQITNNNLRNNPNVRAVLTGQVPVPTGYTYVEGTATTESTAPNSYGVVVKDGSDNEWVWVPVNGTESIAPSDMYETISPTSIASVKDNNDESVRFAYREEAIKLASLSGINGLKLADGSSSSEEEPQGETVTKQVDKKGKTILPGVDRYSPDDTLDYREPALVTDYDLNPTYYKQAGNFATAQEFADAMVKDYNDMIASIEKYGGFYVGRYELSGTDNGEDQEITNPKVQSGQAPMDYVNWYRLYQAERTVGTNSTISTMIWGCQWDVVCLWSSKVGDEVAYDDYEPNRHSNDYATTTGSNANDKRNNVYDLEGSMYEWTQEATYGERPSLSWWRLHQW